MLAAVSTLGVRRVVIVAMRLLNRDAAMVLGAQVGRRRGVTAERQRRDDQQNDQDSDDASHAKNPITSSTTSTPSTVGNSARRRR